MTVKKLDQETIHNLTAYIFVQVQKRFDENNQPYIFNDFYYTDLCRTSKPLYLEKDNLRPYYHLLHLGGGMMHDEKYQTDLIVHDNSSAIFTSQSATKVYKWVEGHEPTAYTVNLEVGKNAMAEYINDSVILYNNSKFIQTNNFYITDSSTLLYSEIFSPGYGENGKKYIYNLMSLKTKIFYNGKILVYDNLVYQPKKEDPSVYGIMDGYDRCGTAIYFSPVFTQKHVEEIRAMLKEQFNDPKYHFGVSSFDKPSIAVRILADETYEIERVFKTLHSYVREKILNLPAINLRKQ